jgi:predicted secreted protein
VTLEPGEHLTISLRNNNPSTGYGWNYWARPSRRILAFVSDRTASASRPGARQPRTIVYRAIRRGTRHLRLVYLPPGRHRKPAGKLTLTIRVT